MSNDSLRVIATMARKGGSGKTTLSRALVSAAAAAGRRVVLIDSDSTGAFASWHQRAAAGGYGAPLLTLVRAESVEAIGRTIDHTYEHSLADLVFVDTVGVGAEWSDAVAVLADHLVTPVMLSTTDLDVGGQTAAWFENLRNRVDDPGALPRHHVVLNMVDPRPTKADAELIARAISHFPVIETVMMRRKAYKDTLMPDLSRPPLFLSNRCFPDARVDFVPVIFYIQSQAGKGVLQWKAPHTPCPRRLGRSPMRGRLPCATRPSCPGKFSRTAGP